MRFVKVVGLLLLFTVFVDTSLYSQRFRTNIDVGLLEDSEYDVLEGAEAFFDLKNFPKAIIGFQFLVENHPNDAYLNLLTGICYLYINNEKSKSIKYIEKAYQLNKNITDINFYLGRAYHINYQFDKAIISFNKQLAYKNSEEDKLNIQKYLSYCENAKKIIPDSAVVQLTNIGSTINTSASEYVPVISADESVLIFTYRGDRSTGGLMNSKFQADIEGEYYEDIFISYKIDGKWDIPKPINNLINTIGHDAAIALSPDGQKLFIYRSTLKDGGDIYESNLVGSEWSKPVKLGANINTKYWEGSVSISSDGKTLYFASEKPGGFGKKDIYKCEKQENGEWSKPINLGPQINSIYNEDAPFIHVDGKTLFFSSDNPRSIGGYDIFYTTVTNYGYREPVVNLGFPINTTQDDIYYVISPDGERGYFASDREGGYGKQDIYMAIPGMPGKKPVLAMLVGYVKKDSVGTASNITVSDSASNEIKGTFNSNSETGKYIIALMPGTTYKVAFEVEGMQQVEYVNISKLETYVQVNHDINFNTKDESKDVTQNNNIQNMITEQINKFKMLQKNEYCKSVVQDEILRRYGDIVKEGITYSVYLGKYQNTNQVDIKSINEFSVVDVKKDIIGNASIYVGTEATLKNAELLLKKLLKLDSTFKSIELVSNESGRYIPITRTYRHLYDSAGCITEDTVKQKVPGETIVGLNNSISSDSLIKDFGTMVVEGLEYKLEIGSVTDTNDFKLGYLAQYGKIEMKKYPDGTYRYTMGPFKTLVEAENFKKELVEKHPEAEKSFVTVFYFGKQKSSVKEVMEEIKQPVKETPVVTDPCSPDKNLDFSWFIDKDLNDISVYTKLLAMAGNYCMEGLVFKVQIGAYRFPENFKYDNVKQYGPAEIIPYEDGITRFTLQQFKTINEAEALRQKCIAKGISDAWVTAVYNGKRILLTDLIKTNFYNKAIN